MRASPCRASTRASTNRISPGYAQPRIKQWTDLKGGTAGVSTYGSLTDQLTRYILKRNGLEPEKDVQIVQAGTTASMLQALKAGRLALAILSPPFKWMAQEAGFTQLGAPDGHRAAMAQARVSSPRPSSSTTIPTRCGHSCAPMWRRCGWRAPTGR